jgi:hypothetical protein
MGLKIARFANLLLIVIAAGAMLAHLYEMPNKLTLSGPDWLAAQLTLYRGWGPFLGPFEVGGVVSTWLVAALTWRRRPAFALTLAAALILTLGLALFFAFVFPVNQAFATWTAATIPADWTAYRDSWEYGHAVRAVLALIALSLLLAAILAETPAHDAARQTQPALR